MSSAEACSILVFQIKFGGKSAFDLTESSVSPFIQGDLFTPLCIWIAYIILNGHVKSQQNQFAKRVNFAL